MCKWLISHGLRGCLDSRRDSCILLRMAKLSRAVLEQFRSWGSIGGKKSSATMTPKQRRARALKAVATREAKRNGAKAAK